MMNNNREYIYSFPNTSCTLRTITYLQNQYQPYLNSVAVINLIDCWLVKLSLKNCTPLQLIKNLQSFCNEMGLMTQPSSQIKEALRSLEHGESPTEVMNRYQVVVVLYGKPEIEEIKIFRDRLVDNLGYCPQNMA